MTRDDVIRMALMADPWREHGRLYSVAALTPETLERFAELVADAERIKYQTEIQRLTDLANTAEKWRGIALAKDGDGRTVQMVQEEARSAEREECAKACEDQRDLREEARATLRAADALNTGDEESMLRALRHESDVRLFHSGIDKCAAAIRARGAAGKESSNV